MIKKNKKKESIVTMMQHALIYYDNIIHGLEKETKLIKYYNIH
jgi:hypothetical protein